MMGQGLFLIDCKSSFVIIYLVSELPRVLARRPGSISVGLIDQDLHPAARVSSLENQRLGVNKESCHSHTLDSCDDFLAIM